MAKVYRMLQHTATKTTHRDAVIGIALVHGFDIVRKWFFANHKYGSEFSHKFGGYCFTFRVVRDRYTNRRKTSGYTIAKCFSITATRRGNAVNVPKWFIHLHKGNE